jgi:hypothetical protein
MRNSRVLISAVFTLGLATSFATDAGSAADVGYLWQVELIGDTARCKVPNRIKFVVADAIISGAVRFRGNAYYPKGRIDDNFEAEFALVRRADDQKPLVTISGTAMVGGKATWTGQLKGCAGVARFMQR